MVSQPRGRHLLPHQDLRSTLLRPARWRTAGSTGDHGNTSSPPWGDSIEPLQQSGQLDALLLSGARLSRNVLLLSAHAKGQLHSITTRHIGPVLIFERLWRNTGCQQVVGRTAGRTPLRVRRQAHRLPHGAASPRPPRQRPCRRQVEGRRPDRRRRCPATPSPVSGHGLARRGVDPRPAGGQDVLAASRTGSKRTCSLTAVTCSPISNLFRALLQSVWVTLDRFSDFWQHAREDFEAEVLFVSKSVGPSLDHADLVVDPFNEPQAAPCSPPGNTTRSRPSGPRPSGRTSRTA